MRPSSRVRPSVAIVSNELFDRDVGRMGGFGWAARASADCFEARPELGLRPLFLTGKGELWDTSVEQSNGVPLLRFEKTRWYEQALRAARPALALTIDYRPNYRPVLDALHDVLILVWVRDPRTPEDHAKVATLRVPSASEPPAGIAAIDCTSLAPYVDDATSRGRRVVVAATAPALAAEKVSGAYGLTVDEVPLLPNPLDPVPDGLEKAARPTVVFLGRLDPIKRPWVFLELARRLPRVSFVVLGQSHFSGEGSWEPTGAPENVRLLGHVDQAEKTSILASSWLLVNTSIHEGLPISFLEALHCGAPVVACQDAEGVSSRFGRYVGRFDGSGLDALGALTDAVEELVDDQALRERLGHDGREWVRTTHTREHFAGAFTRLTTA